MRLAFFVNGKVLQQDPLKIGFATLDFSSTTGNVIPGSLKTVLYNTTDELAIKGAELSPDGTKIYLSHNSHSLYPSTLDMFDLTVTNPIASRLVLSTNSDFADSQIESGMDGILLIPSSNQLYKITNPNTLTPALSNYQSLVSYPATCRFPTCDPYERVRLMQDQIDGEDYSTFGNVTYSAGMYEVFGTQTWSSGIGNNPFNATGIIHIKDSIVISTTAILNINDLTIEFGPNARIIIEAGMSVGGMIYNGGRLNLNNSILTSDSQCLKDMWRGIEVRGKSTSSQGTLTNSVQGKVVMNNSVISNAIKGIVAMRYNMSVIGGNVTFTAVNNGAGGIVRATNSTFLNNQNDVSLLNYSTQTSNNLSNFINCKFETNSVLNRPNLELESHIYLSNVKGISILGCDFLNSNPELFSIDKLGIGINAIGASFTVEPRCMNLIYPCNQLDRGKFEGLTYGISVNSFLSTLTFKCDRTDFKNNAIGIFTAFTMNPKIIRNTFEVKEISTSNPIINQSAGIYMVYTTNYSVEENRFKEFDDVSIPTGTANSYGIVVNNSGQENNLIYKNTFSNLRIGGQSEGINGRTINSITDPVDSERKMSGLQWKCNTFNSPIYTTDLMVIDGVIDYNQGYIYTSNLDSARLRAANNKFSLSGENMYLEHDFKVTLTSKNILYVHTSSTNYVPDSYSGLRMGIAPSQFNGTNIPHSDLGCPSKISDGTIVLSTPFEIFSLNAGKDPYGRRVLSEKNNELIRYLLTDTTVEDGYTILNELLNEKEDYKVLRAENQLFNLNYTLSEVITDNPNLSGNEVELLTIKNTIHQEGIEVLKDENTSAQLLESLNLIMNTTTDIMLKKQAENIYSFSQPLDLSYYFLEDMSPKSYQEENQLKSNINTISIYPNPSSNELTFKMDFESDENVEAKVYSTLGTQIAVWSLNKNNLTVNVSDLIKGIYIVKITDGTGGNSQNIKFIKK